MRRRIKYYGLPVACIFCWVISRSQLSLSDASAITSLAAIDSAFRANNHSTRFVIGNINIEGIRKTKPYIIARELPFKQGDSLYLPDLVKKFEIARQQLMNTTLFNEVVVALKSFRGYEVDIQIEVKERWYIFPVPYIKPVDRNLAEWVKQGLGVDRLNYGFKFTYNNFTGRNDKLKIWLITGYTRQIQFLYEQPYADRTLKHGYKIGFSYGFNKEINYATFGNEQQFIDTLSGSKRWYAHIDYIYRPGLRTFNSFRIALVRQEIDSQVYMFNPKYFSQASRKLTYPEISYTLNYYKVNYIPYPLTGWMGEVSLLKKGLNKEMNLWQVSGKFTKSWELARKTWFAFQTYGVLKLPFDQPFVNQRLFGYSDFYLRGLEDYVIDGMAGILFRNTLRREILHFNVPTYLKSRSHDIIPFRIYVRTFIDAGYSHNPVNPENSLTNRQLYSAGLGMDIVSFYDLVFRLDYSFNQLGQNGVFLHIKTDF